MRARNGIHNWADLFILEVLDPATPIQPVEPGQVGEMVVTSLRKEAAPLIRYRTRDLTRLLPGACDCGLNLLATTASRCVPTTCSSPRGEHLPRPDRGRD
jgi:phenylacetate-coenzyme A ligase PaaK-like adenylate-forming protein